MTTEEMRELDEWCGKTFDLLFAVDCWILSNDGGKTRCSGHFNTEQVAMDHHALNEYFKDSRAYHWQFYQKATINPAAAMTVLKRCAEKCAEKYDIYRPTASMVVYAPSGKDLNQWIVADSEEMQIVGEAPTLELAICLFSKALFS